MHMESQFIAANAGVEFTVGGALESVIAIELVQQAELAPLLVLADTARRVQVGERLSGGTEPDALVKFEVAALVRAVSRARSV